MEAKWFLIDRPATLAQAAERIKKSRLLGIDTEYDSFHYFREKLCLIQVHAGGVTYLFDPLADLDLSFLGDVFCDRQKIKVLHAADNDIRLLKRDYAFDFVNIFDTHRAALMLGFKQLSLEKMIMEFVGVELAKDKKMQRSRWDQRPLAPAQLSYAARDVAYLPRLYRKQMEQLVQKQMVEAAREAFAKIAACRWQERKMDQRGYVKIKGYADLSPAQKKLLKKLYAWRFRRAREENRAVFMFLPDDQLMALVRGKGALEGFLSSGTIKNYGPELVELIGRQTSG